MIFLINLIYLIEQKIYFFQLNPCGPLFFNSSFQTKLIYIFIIQCFHTIYGFQRQ